MANKLIGTKFFKKINENEEQLIRIVKKKNNKYIYYDESDDSHKYKELSTEELNEFTKLKEDAKISFNDVLISTDNGLTKPLKDEIILVIRKNDTENYIVCRQFIPDIFYQLVFPNSTKKGCCVTKDSCPTNIKFKALGSCQKLVSSTTISIYLDDTKEIIYELIKNKLKTINKFFDEQKYLINYYEGIADTLEQLLDETGFWDELEKSLGITKLDSPINNNMLSADQLVYLQNKISYLINNIDIVEYWYDIDISKIKGDYMILKDSNNKLYLLSYLKEDFIKNEDVMSSDEMDKFLSIKI